MHLTLTTLMVGSVPMVIGVLSLFPDGSIKRSQKLLLPLLEILKQDPLI